MYSATALTLGAGFYSPGMLWAAWSGDLSRGYRLGLYGLAAAAGLFAVTLLLSRWLRPLTGVMSGVAVLWLILSVGGEMAAGLPGSSPVRSTLAALMALAAGAVVFRLHASPPAATAIFIVAVILIGSPIVSAGANLLARGESAFAGREVIVNDGPILAPAEAPDVWFIVLDAYPSSEALTTLYDWNGGHLGSQLASRGFDVNGNALTPYAVTHLAVPSILDGRHVAQDVERVGPAEMIEVRRILGGDNGFVRDLRAAGYRTTMLENGWRLLGCGSRIDICVGAPLLDEPAAVLLQQSILGGWTRIGRDSAFPRGVEAVLEWVHDNASVMESNGVPDLVLVHLLAPHPPMFMEPNCQRRVGEPGTGGLAVAGPGDGPEELARRRQLFVDQVRCVSNVVAVLADQLGPDTIVAVVGDHGPDSFGQMSIESWKWTEAMVRERMLTLAAVRLPSGCGSDLVMTPDVVLSIRACLTERILIRFPRAAFVSMSDTSSAQGLVEVGPDLLADLLELRESMAEDRG